MAAPFPAPAVRDGYDLVVRVNPGRDSDLVGQCFLRSQTVLAAPPGLPMSEIGGVVDAVVLAAQSGLGEWTAIGARGEARVVPRAAMRCSSMMVVHEAALAGAGAALLPRWLVEEDLAAGRLLLWGEVPNRQIEAWALHTSRRLASSQCRLRLIISSCFATITTPAAVHSEATARPCREARVSGCVISFG